MSGAEDSQAQAVSWRKRFLRSLGRMLVLLVSVLAVLGLGYALWSPGLELTDGRHDLKRNGLWLQHGWMGDDGWFERNGKTALIPRFREPERIARLAEQLRAHHVTDVFPHVAPARDFGQLPALDAAQSEHFLQGLEGFRVMPWVGGVLDEHCFPSNPRWRKAFAQSVRELLLAHPRLSGVHLNIEPWPSGHQGMLALLDEVRAALPPGKVLSVAAYPPPTRWHPHPEVHWEEAYFREVARRTDQLAVMMYDTALREPRLYQWLMAEWTREVLAWSGETPVLLGLPAYGDADSGYHHPDVENLAEGLRGVHAGLEKTGLGRNYQGIALYSEWELDEAEWRYFREHFLLPPP